MSRRPNALLPNAPEQCGLRRPNATAPHDHVDSGYPFTPELTAYANEPVLSPDPVLCHEIDLILSQGEHVTGESRVAAAESEFDDLLVELGRFGIACRVLGLEEGLVTVERRFAPVAG